MAFSGFHPAVAAWGDARFSGPTEPQARTSHSIRSPHRPTLIAAPTGSGKTLAAPLAPITSGGVILDDMDCQVFLEPAGSRVGTVNEAFIL